MSQMGMSGLLFGRAIAALACKNTREKRCCLWHRYFFQPPVSLSGRLQNAIRGYNIAEERSNTSELD